MLKAKYVVRGFSDIGTGNRDYGQGVVRISESALRHAAVRWQRHQLLCICRGRHELWALLRPMISEDPALICLEYDDRLQLGITQKGQEQDLIIRKARWWEYLHYYWTHTNPMIAIDFRMSVFLTVSSVIFGFLLGLLVSA